MELVARTASCCRRRVCAMPVNATQFTHARMPCLALFRESRRPDMTPQRGPLQFRCPIRSRGPARPQLDVRRPRTCKKTRPAREGGLPGHASSRQQVNQRGARERDKTLSSPPTGSCEERGGRKEGERVRTRVRKVRARVQ